MCCQTCSNHACNSVNERGACTVCQARQDKEKARKARVNQRRREMDQMRRDCGLTAGRDSTGRRIWE